MKRKILSCVLACAMIVTTFVSSVVTISAAGENEAKIGDTEYATLAQAIEKASENDVITVLKDVEIADTVIVNKSVTLTAEDAVTIPAEAMEDKACTTDALEILKRVRPVVASIKDPAEKARVTDALLSSVRNNDGMSDILKATKDSAESKKGKTLEQTIEAQQSAYDSLNPHKKSKE